MDTDDKEWGNWNWRSEGDLMLNGAFFVASGEGLTEQYVKASSVEPKTAQFIDRLTYNVGVFGDSPLPPFPGANNLNPRFVAHFHVCNNFTLLY